ncbi:hypothetical protein AMTRI_Chr12g269090 [Amborella trichopoda]
MSECTFFQWHNPRTVTMKRRTVYSSKIIVLLRYGLQVLLGPDVARFTNDLFSLFYSDFPANILGSFLMGWFGFVFKPTILEFSEELALGLTTGFLGSLTHLQRLDPENAHFNNPGAMGVQEIRVGLLFGPLDVWTRWFLTRFNGRGFGPNQRLMWIPWGTLLANVVAAGIMVPLSALNIAKKTEHYQTVIEVLQLGFLGCMSTVSTFVAEFYSLVESGHVWRAFGYSIFSIGLSFALGTLVYSVAVWTKGHAFTDGR